MGMKVWVFGLFKFARYIIRYVKNTLFPLATFSLL